MEKTNMENTLVQEITANVRSELAVQRETNERIEMNLINRAINSQEAKEAKRIARNIKRELIRNLRKQKHEIYRARKNIELTLIQQERNIEKTINKLEKEINN